MSLFFLSFFLIGNNVIVLQHFTVEIEKKEISICSWAGRSNINKIHRAGVQKFCLMVIISYVAWVQVLMSEIHLYLSQKQLLNGFFYFFACGFLRVFCTIFAIYVKYLLGFFGCIYIIEFLGSVILGFCTKKSTVILDRKWVTILFMEKVVQYDFIENQTKSLISVRFVARHLQRKRRVIQYQKISQKRRIQLHHSRQIN